VDRSWHNIKLFYERLAASGVPVQAMSRLVQDIQTTPYASGLFAWTSMLDLRVAKMPAMLRDPGPHPRISPVFDGNIDFLYVDTNTKNRQWRRAESPARAMTTGATREVPS
jgi:hypothetical protein